MAPLTRHGGFSRRLGALLLVALAGCSGDEFDAEGGGGLGGQAGAAGAGPQGGAGQAGAAGQAGEGQAGGGEGGAGSSGSSGQGGAGQAGGPAGGAGQSGGGQGGAGQGGAGQGGAGGEAGAGGAGAGQGGAGAGGGTACEGDRLDCDAEPGCEVAPSDPQNCGVCGQVCPQGSLCLVDQCAEELTTGLIMPLSMRRQGDQLYFTDVSPERNLLARVSVASGGPHSYQPLGPGHASPIHVRVHQGRLFWSELFGGVFSYTLPLEAQMGSAPTTHLGLPGSWGLDVDPVDNQLVFAASSKIFVCDYALSSDGCTSLPSDGKTGLPDADGNPVPEAEGALGVAAYNGVQHWTLRQSRRIGASDRPGAPVELNHAPYAIVAGKKGVFWTESNSDPGHLAGLWTLQGGEAVNLAATDFTTNDLAIAGEYVYYAGSNATGTYDGAIRRVRSDGTSKQAEVVARGFSNPWGVHVDGDVLYFNGYRPGSSTASILRVKLASP